MRLLLILLLTFFLGTSCQNLYTDIPKGTTSDESITQLVLDYRKLSSDKVAGSIQNNSNSRIYDVRLKMTVTDSKGLTSTKHFVFAKINPYQNYKFKKAILDTDGVELTLQIQSSHY